MGVRMTKDDALSLLDMTQSELARKLGLSYRTVATWRKGRVPTRWARAVLLLAANEALTAGDRETALGLVGRVTEGRHQP